MKKISIITLLILLRFITSNAQTPLANTVHDVVLTTTTEFQSVKTGVAYNPNLNLYYGNAAGVSSYMFETFNASGTSVSAVVGNVDMRGLWWNPLLNQLELNGYGASGVHQKVLNVNGYATAANVVIHNPNTTPDWQANAHYDWVNNHFIYMSSGVIARVSRATNTTVSTNVITGLPTGTTLTNWAIGYTGVPGYEIILYSTSNKKAILVNGATHAYSGETQLPATALSTSQYNVGYANRRLFLYNTSDYKWYGYLIFPENCVGTPIAGAVQASTNTVTCGNTVNLTLAGYSNMPGIALQWQYNSGSGWTNFGANNAVVTSPSITQNTQFRCRVTCTNSGGGTANTAAISVTVTPIEIDLGNDTTICPGIIQTLDATNISGSNYLWNNSATTPSINITNPGIYSVRVTQPNGCIGRDTIEVTAGHQPTNNLAASYNLCVDSTITLNAGNTNCTYLWTPTNAATTSINVATGGNYSVVITSLDKCKLTSNTTVIVRPRPVLNLPVSDLICSTDSLLLDATTPLGVTYDWSNGANTPSIYGKDSIVYSVIVKSQYGCPSWDETRIFHIPDPIIEGYSYVPYFFEELGKVKFAPINPKNVISFLWEFGDGATSTQPYPTHTYDSTGVYPVTVTVFNNCSETKYTQNIHINLPNSIAGLDGAEDILIYPNPASEKIIIQNNGNFKIKSIQLFNTLGAIVYHTNTTNTQTQIDIQKYAQGVYYLSIENQDGQVHYKKVEIIK